MKKEDLFNTRVACKDVEESHKVQEAAFKLGFTWCGQKTMENHLFIYFGRYGELTYSGEDYFRRHHNKLIPPSQVWGQRDWTDLLLKE